MVAEFAEFHAMLDPAQREKLAAKLEKPLPVGAGCCTFPPRRRWAGGRHAGGLARARAAKTGSAPEPRPGART